MSTTTATKTRSNSTDFALGTIRGRNGDLVDREPTNRAAVDVDAKTVVRALGIATCLQRAAALFGRLCRLRDTWLATTSLIAIDRIRLGRRTGAR